MLILHNLKIYRINKKKQIKIYNIIMKKNYMINSSKNKFKMHIHLIKIIK